MTILVIGGSSGLGRALAERFALAGHALVLVSTDRRDTEAVAADLELRYRVTVVPVLLDMADPDASFNTIDAAIVGLPPIAGILLAAGMNHADDEPGDLPNHFEAIVRVNFSMPCRLVNHYLSGLRDGQPAVIIGFGSVAAVRGRTRNAAYSAAKRALDSYFESLRHALSQSNIRVQFYVLGYLDTNLAFGQTTPLPRASPTRLADFVFRHQRLDFGRKYYPGFWQPVCLALQWLPWFVYRKLKF